MLQMHNYLEDLLNTDYKGMRILYALCFLRLAVFFISALGHLFSKIFSFTR